jgi:hypothetical protein
LAIVIRKSVVLLIDEGKPRLHYRIAAKTSQLGGIGEQLGATATAIQIGSEMQTLHRA